VHFGRSWGFFWTSPCSYRYADRIDKDKSPTCACAIILTIPQPTGKITGLRSALREASSSERISEAQGIWHPQGAGEDRDTICHPFAYINDPNGRLALESARGGMREGGESDKYLSDKGMDALSNGG